MPPEEEIERIQSVDRRPTCFLAIPESPEFDKVRESCLRAIIRANYKAEIEVSEPGGWETLIARMSRSIDNAIAYYGCRIIDITMLYDADIRAVHEMKSLGRPTIFIYNKVLFMRGMEFSNSFHIAYDNGLESRIRMENEIFNYLTLFKRKVVQYFQGNQDRYSIPYIIDWNRLERSDSENLCVELLTQLGFQHIEWVKRKGTIDIIAELPKSDPDGYFYHDKWLISTGRFLNPLKDIRHSSEIVSQMMSDYSMDFIPKEPENHFTILIIQLNDVSTDDINHLRGVLKQESSYPKFGIHDIRLRIWDQHHLKKLIYRFPDLCVKYFSEDYRSHSTHRKSFEEINLENVNLMKQLVKKNAELTKEKLLRVSAERDAVWKDLAFVAAHKLGNPVFAIETFLDPIEKRISENNQADAIAILSDFRSSIDKAKDILDQFKHLTTAQNINLEPTQLRPLLDDSCRVAQAQGVEITVKCGENIIIQADPKRLAECFDELIKNSLSWMQDSPKKISIDVIESSDSRSDDTASSIKNLVILLSDNGPGVSKSEKDKIFQAFHSNRTGGSGLGLAFVRRIIEGHGGSIQEIGLADQGCVMRITLPMFDEPSGSMMERFEEPKRKPKSKRKKK
jgi:signal transduction histidine kinase